MVFRSANRIKYYQSHVVTLVRMYQRLVIALSRPRPIITAAVATLGARGRAPHAAHAAPTFDYFTTLVGEVGKVIAAAVPVLVALALALFIWGAVVFIFTSDSDQAREGGKQRMIWGIVALFVIVSVWGLVALLQQIFGVDGDLGSISAPAVPN